MASPVIKSTTNWADESADLSPDWSPTAAPDIPGDDHFSLEGPAGDAAAPHHQEEEHLPTGMGAPQSFCVYVGGLPYSASEDELGFFFLDRNITPVGVRIIMDRETGKSKGFGYLDFETKEDYEAALQMSGANFGGRTIRVSAEEHRREPRRRSREPRGPRRDDREFRRGGRDSFRESDRSFRESFERSSTTEEAEHHERKKLQLKPRTKPLEEMHEDAAGRQRSSIFGNAKPRDETEYQRRRAEREEHVGTKAPAPAPAASNAEDRKDTAEPKHRSGGSTRATPSEASSASPHRAGKGAKGGKGDRHSSGDAKSGSWRGKARDAAPAKKSPEVAQREPKVRTVDTGPKKVKGALTNAFAGLSDSESDTRLFCISCYTTTFPPLEYYPPKPCVWQSDIIQQLLGGGFSLLLLLPSVAVFKDRTVSRVTTYNVQLLLADLLILLHHVEAMMSTIELGDSTVVAAYAVCPVSELIGTSKVAATTTIAGRSSAVALVVVRPAVIIAFIVSSSLAIVALEFIRTSWSTKQGGFWDSLVGNAPSVGVSSGRLQILGDTISANNAMVTRIAIQVDPSRQRGGDLRVGTFAVKPAEVSPPLYLPPGQHVGIWATGHRSVLGIPYEKTLGIMDDENGREGHWSSIPGQEVLPGREISLKRHFKRKGCWRAYLQAVQGVPQQQPSRPRRNLEKKRSYDQYMSSGKRVDSCEPPPVPIVEKLKCADDVERERLSVENKWCPKMMSSVPSSIVEVSMPALKWSQPLRLLLTIPPLLAFPWLGWRLLSVPPEPVLLIDGIVSNQLGLDRRPSWSASLSRLFWSGIVPTGTGGATARVSLPLLVRDGSRWALWTAHGTFTRHGGSDLSWRIQSLFLWDRTYYNRSPSRGDSSTADLIA
ncbi:hypothetical protein FOZ63_003091, partial [Perkinsus olseni]